MATLLYTTTEAVRAVLGVTSMEIEDVQITDLKVDVQLELDLEDVYPEHVALKAKIDNTTATDAEKLLWKKIEMYSMYQGAVLMLPGLQNLIAQKISDGDAEMQRFQKDNLQDTIDRIISARDKYRRMVNPTDFEVPNFTPIGIVVPARDPVVDE